jgi:hypothetical protein
MVAHLAWDQTDCPGCDIAVVERWVTYESKGLGGGSIQRAGKSIRLRQGRCPNCRREYVFDPAPDPAR